MQAFVRQKAAGYAEEVPAGGFLRRTANAPSSACVSCKSGDGCSPAERAAALRVNLT
jgi:hypothetical protein